MLTKNEIKLFCSLGDREARREHGLFVVEGEKMVDELLRSGFAVERLLVTAGYDGKLKTELPGEHCNGRRIPGAETVPSRDMERISRLKTPSDVLAVARIPVADGKPATDGLTLALDHVQDPGNMGTIIRIADWFGIRSIIASADTVDCFNPKVVQATMGALFRVRVTYGNLVQMLEEYRAQGVTVYGTMLEGGTDLYATPLERRAVIVMGSEGKGISEPVAQMLNRRLFIPPYPAEGGGCESLNVAVATAVVCSEARRRERNN